MTNLAMQFHQARKARLQRFAEAAIRLHMPRELPKPTPIATPSEAPRTRREYSPRIGEAPVVRPIIWRIKIAVANEFGITVSELISKVRIADLCLPRYVAMGLMLDLTQMSLPAIGRQMGGRDHTTVINGRNRLAAHLRSEAFRNRYEQIKAGLM